MVIGKMNSMFTRHGRWMFGVITLVIIVSFVGFLTPGFGSLFYGGYGSSEVGEAFGEKITVDALRDQAERDALMISLTQGIPLGNSQLYDYARNQAFSSICQLKAAAARGIVVSDREIADFIAALPAFRGAVGFEIAKYNEFVENVLRRNGLDQASLDLAVRQQLIKTKLANGLVNEVIVTPDEVRQYYDDVRGTYTVVAAEFVADKFKSQVKLGAEQEKAYFEANAAKYTLPEEFRVKMIEYAGSEYIKEASARIKDEDAREYYEKNKKEFESQGKDGKTVTRAFDQAKAGIKVRLAEEEAKTMAREDAQRFAVNLYKQIAEDASQSAKAFAELAGKHGKRIVSLEKLTRESPVVTPEVFAEIARIDVEIPVSNAISSGDKAYVVLLEEKISARKAGFKEVEARVKADVIREEALRMARDFAKKALLSVGKATDKAATMAKLDAYCVIERPEPFSIMNPPYGKNGKVIAQLSEETATGEVSAVKYTEDGALFVYVDKRTAPPAKDFQQQEPFITYMYKRMKQNAAEFNFSMWLQANCKLYSNK